MSVDQKISEIVGKVQKLHPNAETHTTDQNGDWPDPDPLIEANSKPTRFPMAALGPMAPVVEDICAGVKCPAALAGASVLAVASLATQGLYDVTFRGGDTRPTSLSILTIGCSGERKSTTDKLAMIGVERHVKNLRAQAKHQRQMNETGEGEPFPVLSPEILTANGTVEGLQQGFLEGHPSQALMSDEAGQFLGGHSLKAENRLHGLATLSKFWDGGTITKKNRGTGSVSETRTMIDCRLAVHLLGQRVAIAPFLKDPIARGQGSLARFLVHEPQSTIGTRFETTQEWIKNAATPQIMAFADKIEALLQQSAVRDTDGTVRRITLELTPDAIEELVAFYNATEAMLAPAGDLSGYSDLTNKAHENAARIAGVLAVLNDEQCVSRDTMQRGIELAKYFLDEIVRLSDVLPPSIEINQAKVLAEWLSNRGGSATIRELSQSGPRYFRQKAQRDPPIALLKEKSWLRVDGTTLTLNPKVATVATPATPKTSS